MRNALKFIRRSDNMWEKEYFAWNRLKKKKQYEEISPNKLAIVGSATVQEFKNISIIIRRL